MAPNITPRFRNDREAAFFESGPCCTAQSLRCVAKARAGVARVRRWLVWDDLVVLRAFTDQAYNLILLAEDEARMLGQPVVEPEHLLLALTRHGRVRDLCRARGVTGGDVFAAIVRAQGVGDELVLGRVPHSRATDEALDRAVDVAAARGVLGPSSDHLLLAVAAEDSGRVGSILEAVGIDNVEALVDSIPGPRRAAVSEGQLKRWLVRLGDDGSAPRPGPIPPVFERYTAQGHQAVRAAIESAGLLEHHEVEPLHLLLGCLQVSDSAAAQALEPELMSSELDAVGEAMERARMCGPPPAHQSTGLFNDAARWIVAERALSYADRTGHAHIGTGHILLGVLDVRDRTIDKVITFGTGGGPVLDRLGRSLTRALPGDETPSNGARQEAIAFDHLIRILTDQFRAWLPAGWTIYGSARANGLLLRVPDSQSEADYRIEIGWIVRSDQAGRKRLLEVTHAALAALQRAVCETTQTNWPAATEPLPEPHAEISGDDVNPTLRLWYGPATEPILELAPRLLLNSVLHG